MSEGEHKRAGVNTSSEGRPSPRREAGEGTSHVQPNPAESSPAAREVCKGEGPRARPPASTGSGRPAPASRQFHKQETVAGAAVSERSAPPEVVGPGASAQWNAPGAPRAADPWGKGFAQCGGMGKESLATEQRTGGRRLQGPAPPAEPGPEAPLAGVQPPSLPHPHQLRLLGTKPECRRPRFQKALGWRGPADWGPGEGRKSTPPRAQTTPVHPRFHNYAETKSCQSKIHPKEPPSDKMGGWGGGTKELPPAFSTLHSSHQHLSAPRLPTAPGLRAGPELLPRLRDGH